MFIAVDLLARGTDDPSDLRTIDPGFDLTVGAPALPSRYRLKLVAIPGGLTPSFLLQRLRLLTTMPHPNRLPCHICLIRRVAPQLKTKTRLQPTGIAVSIGQHGILPQSIEAIMGQRLSPTLLLKTPEVVVVFKPALAGWHRQRIRQIPLSGSPTPCTSPEARRIFLLDKSWIAPA